MGPDGEEPLFAFLQAKLQAWHEELIRHKALADTGDYPGDTIINDALTLIRPLLADEDSYRFIERLNTLKKDLLNASDEYNDVKNFYQLQRPTWEKLRKAHARYQLNRLQLERDTNAAPALRRMEEILKAPAPYGLIKEADGLIQTVDDVNTALVTRGRTEAMAAVEKHLAALAKELDAAQADAALRTACLGPLEKLKVQAGQQESLAHLAQAESEAVRAFDAGLAKIQEWLTRPAKPSEPSPKPKPSVKPVQVVRAAEISEAAYLETEADVEAFLERLRQTLNAAIAENKRIQIR